MIDYEPKGWVGVAFQLRGSVLPSLLPRIATTVAIGVVAAYAFDTRGTRISPVAHEMVGVALGLLLVLRTNASFDRWREAQSQLARMVSRCRDLTRQVVTLADAGELPAPGASETRAIQRRLAAFYALTRQLLRNERDLASLGALLDDAERASLEPATRRPSLMLTWVARAIADLARDRRLADARLLALDANVTALHDGLGACERLQAPLPFAYAQHVKALVTIFCFTAPFALVEAMHWLTPVASGLVAFALFGIDEVGVELEAPFGYAPNDLPLDRIGEVIETTTSEIVARPRP